MLIDVLFYAYEGQQQHHVVIGVRLSLRYKLCDYLIFASTPNSFHEQKTECLGNEHHVLLFITGRTVSKEFSAYFCALRDYFLFFVRLSAKRIGHRIEDAKTY